MRPTPPAGSDQDARDEGLAWRYRSLSSQQKFSHSPARFKGFSGPVGSGKSAALCFEAVRQTFLNRGRQGFLAAPTFLMLRDATLPGLFKILDELDLPFEHRKADGELKLTGTGSAILLRSLEEPERLRGTNLAWFAIDELSYAKEEAWLRLEARLRDPRAGRLTGFAVWTPKGHDWIYKRFIQKPVTGYQCIQAKPFENHFLLEKTPDYYERLESSYDPKFYQQEVLGEYLNSRSDRVYHCFNPAIHIARHDYDPHQPLLWALDFNVSPMSSVIAQRTDDRLRVIDEIVLERATTEEAVLEFHNRFRQHRGALEIFGDASGRSMHTTGGDDYTTLQRSLYRAGFRQVKMNVPSHNPAVLNRVHKVNAQLTNAYGEVRLEVDPRCQELIKDLEEVLFKPGSGVIDKAHDPQRTHASDALGYLVWTLFGEKTPFGEMGKPLL